MRGSLEIPPRKITENPKFQLAAFFVTAVLFFVVMILPWGECRPTDTDGQCGMGAFFGKVFGLLGAGVILAGGSIGVWLTHRRRKHRDAK